MLTLIALSLAAQTTAAPAADPGAAIQTAAIAYSTCIRGKITAVPATMTPEQGADSVIAQCKAEQTALESAADAQIALAPADQQATARQQLAAGMAQARPGIVAGLTRMRAAQAAPAPAPSPSPSPTPKP